MDADLMVLGGESSCDCQEKLICSFMNLGSEAVFEENGELNEEGLAQKLEKKRTIIIQNMKQN